MHIRCLCGALNVVKTVFPQIIALQWQKCDTVSVWGHQQTHGSHESHWPCAIAMFVIFCIFSVNVLGVRLFN